MTYTGLVLRGDPFYDVTASTVVPLACVVLLSVTFLPVAGNKLALDLVQPG